MSIDPSTYKTGNASPSNSAEDLSDNARVFDVFMNDKSGDSVLDRLGAPIPTLSKALQGIGWVSVGEWSTNPTITEPNQYVFYNNQRFAPVNLPYTVDSAAHHNPNDLTPSELRDVSNYVDDENVTLRLTEAQSQLLNGQVFRGSGLSGVSVGDTLPASSTHILFNNEIYEVIPKTSGEIVSVDSFTIDCSDGGIPASVLRRTLQDNYKFNTARDSVSSMASVGGVAVCLGDSIRAGVGGGGGTYAETSLEITNGAFNRFAFSMANHDPNFVGIDPSYPGYATPGDGGLTTPYPAAEMVVSKNPKYETNLRTSARDIRGEVTVYFLQRTSDAAARADVTIYDIDTDTVIGSAKLDSYTPAITYPSSPSSTTEPVQGRLSKLTIPLSGDRRVCRIRVDNLDVINRGNGVASDGTLVVFGFTIGPGVGSHNLAVSSTTLTDSSAANVTRGTVTSERVAKLKSLDADFVYIGWGTNDSKAGVTTPQAFYDDYVALIEDLRTWKSSIKIALSTAPKGLGGDYVNNYVYNEVVRRVAYDTECQLFDDEVLFENLPTGAYSDNVHPSSLGYQAIHSGLCAHFSIEEFENAEKKFLENRYGETHIHYPIDESQSNFTGNTVSIFEQDVEMPTWCKTIDVNVHVNLARSSADLNQCYIGLKVNDGIVDEATISQSQVSGVALATVTLQDVRRFLNAYQTVNIKVEAANFGIRQSGAISKVSVIFND